MRYSAERQLDNMDDSISITEVVATAELSADYVLSLAVEYPPIAGVGTVIDAAVRAMVAAVVDAMECRGTRQVVTRAIDPEHQPENQIVSGGTTRSHCSNAKTTQNTEKLHSETIQLADTP